MHCWIILADIAIYFYWSSFKVRKIKFVNFVFKWNLSVVVWSVTLWKSSSFWRTIKEVYGQQSYKLSSITTFKMINRLNLTKVGVIVLRVFNLEVKDIFIKMYLSLVWSDRKLTLDFKFIDSSKIVFLIRWALMSSTKLLFSSKNLSVFFICSSSKFLIFGFNWTLNKL